MEKCLKNIADWWEPKEKICASFLLPLFCFVFSFIYQDQFLSETCSEVVKKHLLLFRPYLFFVLLTLFVSTIIFSFISVKFGESIDKYKRKFGEYESKINLLQNNTRELFNGLLMNIHSSLANSNNETRISLYFHSEEDGFVILGRYCPNPTLCTRGRDHYPVNEGIIGKGWSKGWAFEDFGNKTDEERVTIFQEKYSMKNPENLRMKPIQIAALRLTSGNEVPSKRNLGVIVVETMDSSLCSADDIQRTLEGHSDYLATSIRTLQDFIPHPTAAVGIEG